MCGYAYVYFVCACMRACVCVELCLSPTAPDPGPVAGHLLRHSQSACVGRRGESQTGAPAQRGRQGTSVTTVYRETLFCVGGWRGPSLKATWSIRGFLLQNHVIRYKLYLI